MSAGKVDDDSARRRRDLGRSPMREADERHVGAAREGRIVRDETGDPAAAVTAEPWVENDRRLARQRVRAQRVELERGMREYPVERLLTRVPRRTHDSHCWHKAYYAYRSLIMRQTRTAVTAETAETGATLRARWSASSS